MPKTFSKKKGFTLVEILIVIMIVGVLSALAINGYTNYRKSALTDLASDNLIAQLNEQKSKTVHGNFEDSGAKCFGVMFEKVSGKYRTKRFSQVYEGKKIWNEISGAFESIGCDDSVINELDFLQMEEPIHVLEATIDTVPVSDLENLFFRFEPPNGGFTYSENASTFKKDKKSLKITLQYLEDSQYQSEIEINLQSGKAINLR